MRINDERGNEPRCNVNRRYSKRLANVWHVLCPHRTRNGNTEITLEELCRQMWKADKKGYIESYEKTSFAHFIPQFEREDAVRAGLPWPTKDTARQLIAEAQRRRWAKKKGGESGS